MFNPNVVVVVEEYRKYTTFVVSKSNLGIPSISHLEISISFAGLLGEGGWGRGEWGETLGGRQGKSIKRNSE